MARRHRKRRQHRSLYKPFSRPATRPCQLERRRLRFETLEDRRMLSVAGGAEMDADEALQLFSTSTALFVENQGQWQDESVRYAFDGPGVNIAFTDEGLSFLLTEQEKVEGDTSDPLDPLADDPIENPDDYITHSTQFSVSFDGANVVTPVGLAESESRFNYYVGDVANHRSNVPGYETVAYEGLYDGIDLHTFGRRDSLKYEFYVTPGADYRQIEVSYDGVEGLWIDEDGSLHVETELGQLVDDVPYIYQTIEGQQVEVAGRFTLADADTYTFEITGDFDPDVELVVDPNLDWSSYLGGSDYDCGYGIATDAGGNALVTGETRSSGWVSGGWDTNYGGGWDGFVVKLSSGGSHLWSSYLGGSGTDYGYGIATDAGGNALVTGGTYSSGWVSGGWDTNYGGGGSDGFVVKLSSGGSHLWSSYLGGSGTDNGLGIATDAGGNALVTGLTESSGWVSGGWDTSFGGGSYDGFVVKLSSGGSHLWSSYLGGSGNDYGLGIATDAGGNALVTGLTSSSGWVSGGWDTSFGGGSYDGFVVKLSSGGSHLWSSYLGGSGNDYGLGIATDAGGNALVTGYTESSGWVSGGWDTNYGGGSDGFVVKLSSGGSHLWSSYLGGSGNDYGLGIATDAGGNALVTGYTESSGWVSGGWDTSLGGSTDGFVVKLSSGGSHLWSSYLGGSGYDYGRGIATDAGGNALVTGDTESSGWFSGGWDTNHGGSKDGFVVRIEGAGGSASLPDLQITESDVTLVPEGGGQRVTATVRNNGGVAASNVAVRFRDLNNSAVVGTQTIPTLAPYSQTDVSILWTPSAPDAVLEVMADPSDLIEETSNENNVAYASLATGVAAVVAAYDEDSDPTRFGRYVSDIELLNTFEAVAAGPNIDHVTFTLGSYIETDYSSYGGWTADFDMGQLAGDTTLTVAAYDSGSVLLDTWAGTVHVVDFPSWLGTADEDDSFDYIGSAYNLNGFFPEELQLSHTIGDTDGDGIVDEDWLIIGGMESELRLGVDLGITAGLNTDQVIPVDYSFVFEAKVLDEQLFDYNNNPFDTTLSDDISVQFNPLVNADDFALEGLGLTMTLDRTSLFSDPITIAGPPMTIPIGPVPTVVEAGVRFDLELEAQLKLGLLGGGIEVLEGTYFETIVTASPYVYGGVGVSLASAGVEVAGNLGLHYRFLYDSTNGPSDQKWGTFGLTFSAVAKLGWWEARAEWSPENASWEFGDVPEGVAALGAEAAAEGKRPDILPWPNVTADDSGNVLLTRVIDLDADPGEIDPEIFYAMRDATGTWTGLSAVAENDLIEGDSDGAFDGAGGAVVSWVANTIDPSLVETTPWETVLDTQEIYSAYWDGATWSTPQVVTSDTQSDGGPEVAFYNGQGLMVWEHAGGTSSTDLDGIEIMYSVWDDVGKVWGSPVALTSDTEGDWAPTLAFDNNGNAMAVWVHDDDSDPLTADLRYATWNGSAWSAIGTVPVTSTSAVREPRVAFDSSGNALLAWIGNEGAEDVLYTSTWNGSTWGTPAVIDGTPGFMEGLDLSISGADEAMLVWHGWDGEHDLFSTVRDLGSADPWTPPARMTDNADGEWMVTTTFDSLGEPVSVWANENVTTVFGDGAEGIELELVPDLSLAEPELISIGTIEGEPAQLLVDVANTGWSESAATTVTFYVGDPGAGGTPIGSPVAMEALMPGDSQTVVSSGFSLPAGMSDFYAVVTADPSEVDTANNTAFISIDAVPPDTTGPTVSVAELAGGGPLAPSTSLLTLQFDEPVLSVLEGDLSVVEGTLGMVVPDHVYLSADKQQATLIFEGGLPMPGTSASYTLKVLDRVLDLAGNPLNDGADEVFNFSMVQHAADFDMDGDVDGRDFLAWQRGHGIQAPNATKADGDADNDLDVDVDDLGIWQGQFGHIPSADFDTDGDVDGRDFLAWQRGQSPDPLSSADLTAWQGQFGTGGAIAAVTIETDTSLLGSEFASATVEPVAVESPALTNIPQPLSAELVDAAFALDRALRPKVGAHRAPVTPAGEDHFNWLPPRATWAPSAPWHWRNEIAEHSLPSHANEHHDGRFDLNIDEQVDEELLDELFAEDELMVLL